MRLLDQFIDPGEAAVARQRLRAAGIATRLDSVDPHSIQPSKSGATRIGLYVLLDEQYADAVELLENPDHAPERTLSEDEIDRLEAAAEKGPKSSRQWSEHLLTLLFFACLLGLIVFTAVDFFLGL